MPSKIQHELNRIRGKTLIKEEKYTDTIAELKEKIVTLEKEVLILDEEKIKHLSKINKIKTLSKNAYQRATEQHDQQRHKERTRKYFMGAPFATDGGANAYGTALDAAAVEYVAYRGMMPDDFKSLNYIELVWSTMAYESGATQIVVDLDLEFGGTNIVDRGIHTESISYFSGTEDNIHLDVGAYDLGDNWTHRLTITPAGAVPLNELTKNDIIVVNVKRDAVHADDNNTKDLIVIGLLFDYIADM